MISVSVENRSIICAKGVASKNDGEHFKILFSIRACSRLRERAAPNWPMAVEKNENPEAQIDSKMYEYKCHLTSCQNNCQIYSFELLASPFYYTLFISRMQKMDCNL